MRRHERSLKYQVVWMSGSRKSIFCLQSMHFGIYLFIGFEDHLKPPDTVLLRRISRIRTGNERKIVFLGASLSVPEEIEGSLQRLNPDSEVRTPPRLRDGRWVS